MKTTQLSGSLRANVGKKDAASLRNSGMVPCVLYGQGEQTHFAVKQVEMNKIIFSPDVYQVDLDIEGKKSKGIVREVQQHPTKDTIQHVDFYELNDTKKVRVSLPVRTTGAARGVLNGGRLNMAFRSLSCYGLPGDLPEKRPLLIPFFGSTYGYYLFRKDHLDMMQKSGMKIYSLSFLITTAMFQSIIPLIVYLIFYFIF